MPKTYTNRHWKSTNTDLYIHDCLVKLSVLLISPIPWPILTLFLALLCIYIYWYCYGSQGGMLIMQESPWVLLDYIYAAIS